MGAGALNAYDTRNREENPQGNYTYIIPIKELKERQYYTII